MVDQNRDSPTRSIAYISIFFENVEVGKGGVTFCIKIGFL